MTEVVATGNRARAGQLPFQRRNVQEWSRLDELTGMLEHARVETDHWTANTGRSSHQFGKVVDSRSRNLGHGGLEQRQQTKQLEVFQTSIPGGSLQVIRSQSVTSTSSSWQGQHKLSSSRWNCSTSEAPSLPITRHKEFDNLKLALNPLDLSSQKTKVSVGRSGSIGSRRPPSRPKSVGSLKADDEELSKITHQVNQEAKEKLFTTSKHVLLSNGLSRPKHNYDVNDTSDFPCSSEGRYNVRNSSVHEIAKSSSESTISSSRPSLTRKKSCSSEDLQDIMPDGAESDMPQWNRSSKMRRSLQLLKPNIPVVSVTKSVSQIKEEIEARKQIVHNVLKDNQWNNLGELEGVLGVMSNGSNGYDTEALSPSSQTKKRQSFITVESLKEVRGRLRKLNSPTDDTDDGIVTEVKSVSPVLDQIENISRNSLKSVFRVGAVLQRGTGSLESRSSNKTNGNGNSRTEEWYNRRKSYGFEQVNGEASNQNTISIDKSKVDSSTDSGICRSSEAMDKIISDNGNKLKASQSIVIKHPEDDNERDKRKDKLTESGAVIPIGGKTVVTLGMTNHSQANWNLEDIHGDNDDKKETVTKGKIADALRKLREKSSSFQCHRLSEPITISIPIQQGHSKVTDPKLLLLKQTKETSEQPSATQNMTSYSHLIYGHNVNNSDKVKEDNDVFSRQTNRTKTLSNWFDSELKRHSIAVDEAKYMTNRNKPYSSNYLQEHPEWKISLPASDPLEEGYDKDAPKYSDYEINTHEKKQKKVEFCKTEVHFAAEPGRFNIVETDGKPPPSNMYRRRKKTNSESNRNGLPEIRFGDSQYEKNLLTGENNDFTSDSKIKPLTFRGSLIYHDTDKGDTTTSSCTYLSDSSQEEQKTVEPQIYSEDETLKPRSILKNNISKPCDKEPLWGVKLKSVYDTERVDQESTNETKETEFQKLLRSLRPATQFVRSPEEPSSIAADNGLEVRISSATTSWSSHVEDLRSKGYLTKVNFGVGEAVVIDSETEDKQRKHVSRCETGDQLSNSFNRERHFVNDAEVMSESQALAFPHTQNIETLVNSRPKVTSVSLNYEKPTTLQSGSVYSRPIQESSVLVKNTLNHEIIGNVEEPENGTRIWSFCKTSSPSKIKNEKLVPPLATEEINNTDKQRSLSPSTKVQKKYTEEYAEKTSQTEPEYVNIKKDVKSTQTSCRQRIREKVKKEDSQRKERKLCSSSSGRDSWLNTPKQPQVRPKSDVSFRKLNLTNTNVSKSSTVRRNQLGSESPVYQNREVFTSKKDTSETESAILEELTKAADQILLAVNGYTDDDSFRGSSEDEHRRRQGREKIVSKPLCTISETPNKKITNTNYRKVSNVTAQKTRPRIGKTSSNSSIDTTEDRSKRRAARLLQRANSRELLLQTAASSSEDIGSGSETTHVRTKQRIVRRARTATAASESRTRERVERTVCKSDRVVSRRTNIGEGEKRPVAGSAKPERRSLAASSSVSNKKKSYTSQSEESAKSRE